MLELALIAPFEHLEIEKATNYHLMLPENLRDPDYAEHYQELCDDWRQFVILDNGAAEDGTWGVHPLYLMADQLPTNVVVLPDVIKDGPQTVQKLRTIDEEGFLDIERYMQGQYINGKIRRPGLMFVPQGTTLFQFQECMEEAAKHPEITYIGVPRHMTSTLRDGSARLEFVLWCLRQWPGRFKYHFLGTNPLYITEVEVLGQVFAQHNDVIGIDTSAPFNYAIAHQYMGDGNVVNRPENYFDCVLDDEQLRLAAANIKYMKQHCGY